MCIDKISMIHDLKVMGYSSHELLMSLLISTYKNTCVHLCCLKLDLPIKSSSVLLLILQKGNGVAQGIQRYSHCLIVVLVASKI